MKAKQIYQRENRPNVTPDINHVNPDINNTLGENPSIIVEKAVKGMLPKNKLGAAIFKNLRVYNDELHKQESQSPEPINLNNI